MKPEEQFESADVGVVEVGVAFLSMVISIFIVVAIIEWLMKDSPKSRRKLSPRPS
jgi:hypothetical protein